MWTKLIMLKLIRTFYRSYILFMDAVFFQKSRVKITKHSALSSDGTGSLDGSWFSTFQYLWSLWIQLSVVEIHFFLTLQDGDLQVDGGICDALLDKSFSSCHDLLDPSDIIKNCRLDVASKHKSLQTSMCNNLVEYSRSCCHLGITLDQWAAKYNCCEYAIIRFG